MTIQFGWVNFEYALAMWVSNSWKKVDVGFGPLQFVGFWGKSWHLFVWMFHRINTCPARPSFILKPTVFVFGFIIMIIMLLKFGCKYANFWNECLVLVTKRFKSAGSNSSKLSKRVCLQRPFPTCLVCLLWLLWPPSSFPQPTAYVPKADAHEKIDEKRIYFSPTYFPSEFTCLVRYHLLHHIVHQKDVHANKCTICRDMRGKNLAKQRV